MLDLTFRKWGILLYLRFVIILLSYCTFLWQSWIIIMNILELWDYPSSNTFLPIIFPDSLIVEGNIVLHSRYVQGTWVCAFWLRLVLLCFWSFFSEFVCLYFCQSKLLVYECLLFSARLFLLHIVLPKNVTWCHILLFTGEELLDDHADWSSILHRICIKQSIESFTYFPRYFSP